jgi:hypothetical protein
MGVAIIGHGPSLKGAGRGEYIDSFDYVVRFPYSGDWQTPEDYGTKTTFICSTLRRAKKIRSCQIPDKGYFIWSKYGRWIPPEIKDLIEKYGGEDATQIVRKWQRRMSTHHYLSALSRESSFFSHGTASICIMADRLRKHITVFGCDSLKNGVSCFSPYSGSWVHENRKQKQSNHAFDAERLLIDQVAKQYDVKIGFE